MIMQKIEIPEPGYKIPRPKFPGQDYEHKKTDYEILDEIMKDNGTTQEYKPFEIELPPVIIWDEKIPLPRSKADGTLEIPKETAQDRLEKTIEQNRI